MITAKEMRRLSLENTGELCRAEAHILTAASHNKRRCLIHYDDAHVANAIEEILIDQGFRVSVDHDGVSNVWVMW